MACLSDVRLISLLWAVWLYWACPCAAEPACPSYPEIQSELGRLLSAGSSIDNSTAAAQRWSEFDSPQPAYVVNVASENDVATTVTYCNQRDLTFLAQNGGNGWASTFDLGECGIIINIGGLGNISFNANKTEATIQGGARVQAMVDAAYGNDTRFANPTCNCLGFLGAALGGGLTRTSGLYGWGVDQILSMNIVLANGTSVQASDTLLPDLFWAALGAAANFGIVTSAVIKAYPVPAAQNVGWQGPLVFSEDKLEALVQAVNDLELRPEMQIDVLLGTSGPPSYSPVITAIPLFIGNASAGEQAFKPILDLGPTSNNATEIPYSQWSAWGDGFCAKGGRKPAYGASTAKLDAKAWTDIYSEFKSFVASNPTQFGYTSILAENYALKQGRPRGGHGSSYPYGNLPHHIVAIPWYSNSSDDEAAADFGNRVRDLLRYQDGESRNTTYVNFAHGDESLSTIYGSSLPQLRALKDRYDPYRRFSQWFPIV